MNKFYTKISIPVHDMINIKQPFLLKIIKYRYQPLLQLLGKPLQNLPESGSPSLTE